MGIRVESQNVSEERIDEFQKLADRLLEQGYQKNALVAYIAQHYMCGVSLRYEKDDIILNLHQLKTN